MPCEVVPCAFGVSLLFMTELRAMQRRLEKMDHWRASDFGKKKINWSCFTNPFPKILNTPLETTVYQGIST
jgi:hypothetical protein